MANRLAPAPPRLVTTRKKALSASMRKCAPIHGKPTGRCKVGAAARSSEELHAGDAQIGEASGKADEIDDAPGHARPVDGDGENGRGKERRHPPERHRNRHRPRASPPRGRHSEPPAAGPVPRVQRRTRPASIAGLAGGGGRHQGVEATLAFACWDNCVRPGRRLSSAIVTSAACSRGRSGLWAERRCRHRRSRRCCSTNTRELGSSETPGRQW